MATYIPRKVPDLARLRPALEAMQHHLRRLPPERDTAELTPLTQSLIRLDRDIQDAKRDGRWTSRFELFQILERTRDEGLHSNILAWLLDPSESHNLGDTFLLGVFRLLGRCSIPKYHRLAVIRECRITEQSRLDILVCTDKWRLAIENKIDAYEGKDQLRRYKEWLSQTGQIGDNRFLIYLTPDRRHWSEATCVSYDQIRSLLRNLSPNLQPQDVITAFLSNIAANL